MFYLFIYEPPDDGPRERNMEWWMRQYNWLNIYIFALKDTR
jgi:hypothetical protein